MDANIVSVVAFFFQLCLTLANALSCNVIQRPEGTLYQVDQTDASQDYFWKNATDHTLAFQEESEFDKMEQVLSCNKTHLGLNVCQQVIRYSTIDSKGETHTAECSTICRQEDPAGAALTWIYWVVGVLLVLVLVLVLVLIIVRYKKRLQDGLSHIFCRLGFQEVPNEADPEAAVTENGVFTL